MIMVAARWARTFFLVKITSSIIRSLLTVLTASWLSIPLVAARRARTLAVKTHPSIIWLLSGFVAARGAPAFLVVILSSIIGPLLTVLPSS